MEYPEYIMRNVRQTYDLEPDDTSLDEMIEALDPEDIVAKYLNWEGIIGYANKVIRLVRDVYEFQAEKTFEI